MGNISKLCQFGWYKSTCFREAKSKFPFQTELLGLFLGPTRNDGNDMYQAILHMNIQGIPRQSLCRHCPNELAPSNKSDAQKQAAFDEAIWGNRGDLMTPPKLTP